MGFGFHNNKEEEKFTSSFARFLYQALETIEY